MFLPVERSITVSEPQIMDPHFVDFLFNRGSYRRIADICIDLNQEVSPYDHWLAFRVVNVCWNDCAAASNFIANKFRGHVFWNRRPKGLAAMLMGQGIARSICRIDADRMSAFPGPVPGASEVLANCDEFHLRSDHALSRI